jgi:tetratricopeptide (TPR) repeat protein
VLSVALCAAGGVASFARAGLDSPGAPSDHGRISKADKAKLLKCLYKQLEGASNTVVAERLASAIELLWRQSGSETVDLLMERSTLALQAYDFDLAFKYLSAVVRIAPDYAEGWNQLANVYLLKEEYPAAMRQLRHVLALDPHHFVAITNLGRILRELGNKRSALNAFRLALKANPFMLTARQAEDELGREVEGQQI